MYNPQAYALGTNRSCIRDLFEYGAMRAAIVGRENIYDYSLGNPSIPAPAEVDTAIRAILEDTPSLAVHGYTSAAGTPELRQAIADDLNRRFHAGAAKEDLFICCGAAPELTAVFHALAFPGMELLAIAPYFPEYKPFAEAAGASFKVVPADIPISRSIWPPWRHVCPPTQAPSLSIPPTTPPARSILPTRCKSSRLC